MNFIYRRYAYSIILICSSHIFSAESNSISHVPNLENKNGIEAHIIHMLHFCSQKCAPAQDKDKCERKCHTKWEYRTKKYLFRHYTALALNKDAQPEQFIHNPTEKEKDLEFSQTKAVLIAGLENKPLQELVMPNIDNYHALVKQVYEDKKSSTDKDLQT